ncbi:MAG: cytochrome c1, partial [Alphaproteobacteria bacterium]
MTRTLLAALTLAATLFAPFAYAAEGIKVPAQKWSFNGLHGTYDKDEIYRGYMVATNVCMACHSFKYIS